MGSESESPGGEPRAPSSSNWSSMAKPCGVRLSGEARKQVRGTGKLGGGRGALLDRGEAGCSGRRGRAGELPQPLSSVLSLLPGDSRIPALGLLCTEHGLPRKSGLWWERPEPSWRAFSWGWDLTVDN